MKRVNRVISKENDLVEWHTINKDGHSFLEFQFFLKGFRILNKRTEKEIPKFLLFWRNIGIKDVRNNYNLVKR